MLVKSFFKITSINALQRKETIEREKRPVGLELTFSNPRNQWKKCLCFFQKSFSLPLKNYSFQWHEILDTNLDNLISDIGHIDSIESHEKFTFYFAKKNPDMKSSLFWSGYLNTLISYPKSWYQYQNKNIFFTWTLEPC